MNKNHDLRRHGSVRWHGGFGQPEDAVRCRHGVLILSWRLDQARSKPDGVAGLLTDVLMALF